MKTDHADIRNGTICDKEFAFKLIGLEKENFVEESYKEIDLEEIAKLFYRTDKWQLSARRSRQTALSFKDRQ